ncbi:hypothetical protein EDD85DRAFT_961232 [Armillaria nabsnona]|nr:hypothetical protein EDD85DRAFT_961232 [Armillaria nabsnona]
MLLLPHPKPMRHRQFTVVPMIKDAVTEGEETLVNPEPPDFIRFRLGCKQQNRVRPSPPIASSSALFALHSGNNNIAYKSSQSTTISQSFADTFDYPYDTALGPTGGSNIDAAAPTPSTLSTKSTTMRTNMDGQKHPTISKTRTFGREGQKKTEEWAKVGQTLWQNGPSTRAIDGNII